MIQVWTIINFRIAIEVMFWINILMFKPLKWISTEQILWKPIRCDFINPLKHMFRVITGFMDVWIFVLFSGGSQLDLLIKGNCLLLCE